MTQEGKALWKIWAENGCHAFTFGNDNACCVHLPVWRLLFQCICGFFQQFDDRQMLRTYALTLPAADATNLSVEEIAAMLGYSNSSNFYKAFREYYYQSPREFIKWLLGQWHEKNWLLNLGISKIEYFRIVSAEHRFEIIGAFFVPLKLWLSRENFHYLLARAAR